jgi:hypothetical protein
VTDAITAELAGQSELRLAGSPARVEVNTSEAAILIRE